ncbi:MULTISPECIES: AAA family ATPase [unclassified Breznakia]|uniref:ParA family protein n=1 Tax=unclassified Breznakia TaxID=2623764 RepID=UPI0024743879|nr:MULTISPECIES: AAA family ATPase [unclassified Breznakia]MDH6367054.1 chromosome partitioning protein [Breznakia sp. PH1-1]MDH6404174.1 chromosome partitioning protein [Breznakia sp. PF1-11]MDH6411941.1 chromosome partitioning protein [Breznakia sp. PFB1-11]MDH6414162.1 chromosome partitioning protein [Breznakia sp. PFB1-14]MDH6418915.1 chromosome partitioning protein [Breznakia sp. PFB1-12]
MKAKIINISNQKGGCAKTGTGLSLAGGLAKQGYSVLYIDGDDQGDSTAVLLKQGNTITSKDSQKLEECIDANEGYVIDALEEFLQEDSVNKDLGDVLVDPRCVNEVIKQTAYENIDIIPASFRMVGVQQKLLFDSTLSPTSRLKMALKHIEKEYDYIVIDNKPAQDFTVTNNLIVSDLVIVPIKVDRGALKGFLSTFRNMQTIQANNDCNYEFKILFTMVNRNNEDRFIIDLFKKYLPNNVFDTTIRYQAKPFATASMNNQILIDNTTSGVANDYLEFIKEVEKLVI